MAFEGIDGCGKSTQARLLAERWGPDTVLTSEPGATALGVELRRLMLDPDLPTLEPRAEALLMAADRAQHVAEVIAPALEARRRVVSDRFSGSTLAYQGYGRGLGLGELGWLVAWASAGTDPDLVVLLDLDPDEAARRRGPAGDDRLEGLGAAFQRRVRDGYLALAADDPGRWVVVDATGTVPEVSRRVERAVEGSR